MRDRWLVAAGLSMAMLMGCGGSGSMTTPTPTPTPPAVPVLSQAGSVTIAPKYAAAGVGGSVQYTATIAGGGGATVQWLVNGVQGGMRRWVR